MAAHKKEIFKIQTSLFTSSGEASVLIYNKDRSAEYETTISDEVNAVLKIMGGDPKKFFYGKGVPNKGKKGESLELIEEAPWQDW